VNNWVIVQKCIETVVVKVFTGIITSYIVVDQREVYSMFLVLPG